LTAAWVLVQKFFNAGPEDAETAADVPRVVTAAMAPAAVSRFRIFTVGSPQSVRTAGTSGGH
jgi:hypothetical protein